MELKEFVRIMNVSDWIAFLSFVVAFGSLVWTACTSKKLRKQEIKLNEFQLEKNKNDMIAKKQALIMATVKKTGKILFQVTVQNKGLAIARNIRIESDAIENESDLYFNSIDTLFPFPILNPTKHFSFDILSPFEGYEGHPIPVKFIWDDEYSNNRTTEQALPLV